MPTVSLGAVWLSNQTMCVLSIYWWPGTNHYTSRPLPHPVPGSSGLLVPGLPFFFISRITWWGPVPFHGTNDLVGMSKKPTEVSL